MLQLTAKATERLKTTLSELELGEAACFRLGVTQEGVKIAIDQERPGDTTLEDEGKVLLVMDSISADRFYGRTMDYDEDASQLVFT